MIPSKHLLRSMLIGTAVGVVMAIMGGLRSAHDAPAVYATQDYGNLVEMGAVVGCVTGLVHYATREWRTRVLREWYWASWIVSFTAGLGVGFFIPSVLPPPDTCQWTPTFTMLADAYFYDPAPAGDGSPPGSGVPGRALIS